MGLSTGAAPAKASVYTYHFKDFSLGRLTDQTTRVMPRKFFTAHLQSYIISERYAKQGILDFINFIELNPDRRSNVILFVTANSLYPMMESYTPMDKVPGRFIRSLANQVKPNFSLSVYTLRIKDLENELHHHTPTVIPMVHYTGQSTTASADRLDTMDASNDGITFSEGAVFIHARMAGKLDEQSKNLFYVVNKKYKKYLETLKVNGAYVDVEGLNIKVKRTWNQGDSRFKLDLYADLRLLNNQQQQSLTEKDLHQSKRLLMKSSPAIWPNWRSWASKRAGISWGYRIMAAMKKHGGVQGHD